MDTLPFRTLNEERSLYEKLRDNSLQSTMVNASKFLEHIFSKLILTRPNYFKSNRRDCLKKILTIFCFKLFLNSYHSCRIIKYAFIIIIWRGVL